MSTTPSISPLSWTRRHDGAQIADIDAKTQLRILPERLGYGLYLIAGRHRERIFGGFLTEDDAKTYAARWVGDE